MRIRYQYNLKMAMVKAKVTLASYIECLEIRIGANSELRCDSRCMVCD